MRKSGYRFIRRNYLAQIYYLGRVLKFIKLFDE